ncbi:unnamed protein product [Ascophyllum nodosum]
MRDFDGSLRPTLVKTGLDKTCLAINFLVWKLSSLYQATECLRNLYRAQGSQRALIAATGSLTKNSITTRTTAEKCGEDDFGEGVDTRVAWIHETDIYTTSNIVLVHLRQREGQES